MNPKRTYYDNGQIWTELWFNEAGELHRLDGPAYKEWYENRQFRWEAWFISGGLHRLDGPAYQSWCNGQLRSVAWHINGVEYKTEAEFQVAVDLYKANEITELF